MDHLNRTQARWPWLPLVGLAVAGLPWLAVRSTPRSSIEETLPAQATAVEAAAAKRPRTEKPLRPELLHPGDSARRMSTEGDRVLPVAVEAFPDAQDARTETADPADTQVAWPGVTSGSQSFPISVIPGGRAESAAAGLDAAGGVRPEQAPAPAARAKPVETDDGETEAEAAEPKPSGSAGESPRSLPKLAASLLLPPETSTRRSEQLEHIAQQADRQVRHGLELAARKAHFAARSEFIAALRLMAQGLDTEHQTTLHSRSLAAGLAALKEAEDFVPAGSRLEADVDIPRITVGHRTPVLKGVETESLTPLLALKCYFTFAQEQLAASVGREIAGSMALRCLGKLHATVAEYGGLGVRAAEPKAMAYYQAALLVYPRNYMAANDLGVLLARCGSFRQAKTALEHSLSIHQQSACWHNLAVVYRQLGQAELARQAGWRATTSWRAEAAGHESGGNASQRQILWVDPNEFAARQAQSFDGPRPSFARREPNRILSQRPTPAERPTLAERAAATQWPTPAKRPTPVEEKLETHTSTVSSMD